MKRVCLIAAVVFLSGSLLSHALAQDFDFDFGDAPEGALAYPSTGLMGMFPTCTQVGPAGFILHSNFGGFFGAIVDFEPDGNAGFCPPSGFPPYDLDECFADANGDGGLLVPPAYTIDPTPAVVPCQPGVEGPLGNTCQTAVWGANVDIIVNNFMPGGTVGYVNVLMDWNQDGDWNDVLTCYTQGDAPEHVLIDFPVPNGFSGPLSFLMPPPFLIGPNPGYVWTRFTLTERPVFPGWTGEGSFEDGESEDYLLRVDPDQQPTIFPLLTECPEEPTRCPVIETQCPLEPVETQCPLEETRCPIDPTFCPVVETECPAEPTICSVTMTECPDPTQCPPDQTHCPVEPTLCPIIATQCPIDPVQTICPEIITECPVVETECPQAQTFCPEIPTWCPETQTLCPKIPEICPPEEFTIWPIMQTQCPIFFTECPQGPTLCPQFPTECPSETTWCPEIPTVCPIEPVFTFCPLNETLCPETPTVCPAQWTFCPDIPTICIDILTECPVVPTECPEVPTECPDALTVCPVDPTFCPEILTECPIEPTQCPVEETSCPTGATWCPTDPTNCPQVTTECPVASTQCPVNETTCPTGPTWCPVNPTYCPVLDSDGDGVIDCYDNCPPTPNGLLLGTCVKAVSLVVVGMGTTCNTSGDCKIGETCDKAQGDINGNGCGDACECYADISGSSGVPDGKVDLSDLVRMKSEFGKPCPPSPCTADLNGDGKVDLSDLVIMKMQFGKSGCPC